MIYIGIDPGQKGGIAFLKSSALAFPMPETPKQVLDLLQNYVTDNDVTVVIESVSAMPKQGVCSMFNFGRHYGELMGICTALGYRILNPKPQAWKKVMLAGTDKSKDASILMCEHLFPEIDLVLPRCRKPNDGMAEAALLAEYGRRQNVQHRSMPRNRLYR